MRRSTVVIELAGDAALSRDLAAGGVFVPGCTLRIAEECELVVCGANRRVSLPARVVWVDEQRGAGLELIGFSTAMREQIAELAAEIAASDDDLAVPIASESDDDHRTVPVFAIGDATADATADATTDDVAAQLADLADVAVARQRTDRDLFQSDPALAIAEADAAFFDIAYPPPATAMANELPDTADTTHEDGTPVEAADDTGDRGSSFAAADEPADELAGEPALEADAAHDDDAGDREAEPRISRNLHERLRGLTLVAQIKLAAGGELHERIVLERLYGKNVWETLLRNPRLTAPEVSRIARYGSLPRVLLEIILANNAWLAVPEVRRALLSNPRLGTDQIMKVLRLVPKHELRLAAIQTAYPHPVRNAAKQLLRGE